MSLGWPYGLGASGDLAAENRRLKKELAKAREPGAVTPTSLRDWFAGQVITGVSTNLDRYAKGDEVSFADLAKIAYGLADAMMIAREDR